MDLRKLRLALLKTTLAVFAITTWVFVSFVLSTRPEQPVRETTLTSLVRLPASLPENITGLPGAINGALGPKSVVVDRPEMNILKVGCWDTDKAQLNNKAAWVRFVGRSCGERAQVVNVRNLTNGYNATVFAMNGGKLTTDFIPMESGANEIEVTVETEPEVASQPAPAPASASASASSAKGKKLASVKSAKKEEPLTPPPKLIMQNKFVLVR